MIALRTPVLAGVLGEPGEVVGRATGFGGTTYHVRFADGRVRAFRERWVRVAVAPAPRIRLATINGVTL